MKQTTPTLCHLVTCLLELREVVGARPPRLACPVLCEDQAFQLVLPTTNSDRNVDTQIQHSYMDWTVALWPLLLSLPVTSKSDLSTTNV